MKIRELLKQENKKPILLYEVLLSWFSVFVIGLSIGYWIWGK